MPTPYDQNSTPGQRLLKMYALLLFSGRKFSMTELAERMNCSKQTIMRLLDQLSQSGEVFIEDDVEEDGIRWIRIPPPKGKKLDVALKPEAIQHLLLCRDMVKHLLPRGYFNEVGETAAKAATLLPDLEQRSKALSPIGQSITKGQIDYSPHQAKLAKLLEAISDNKVCAVVYRSPNNDKSKEFLVAPFKLVSYHETLYVNTWRVTDDRVPKLRYPDVTPLALHRLSSVEILDRTFESDDEGPTEQTFGVMNGESFEVKAWFSSSVAEYVEERQWSADQTMNFMPNGDMLLTFTASSRSEVVSWILGFGVNAELKEPLDLRQEIKRNLGKMRDRY